MALWKRTDYIRKKGSVCVINSEWEEIRADYDKAKFALWGSKKLKNWSRDEEIGYYYMWKAYHEAKNSAVKDHLVYARVLNMVSGEYPARLNEYQRLHKYIKPALEEYHLAIESGQFPEKEELDYIQLEHDTLSHRETCMNAPYDEQIKLIKGYKNLGEFSFYDSKIILFQHSEHQAKLKLEYNSMVATFTFHDVYEICINSDPAITWITEFSCYPCFHDKTMITFDIEDYRLKCKAIYLKSIENIGDTF